jgi:phage terminase large subunit-like protein
MMSARWQAGLKLVENKANGEAVISSLKHEIAGIVAFNPRESKQARMAAVAAPQIESGNVYLPYQGIAPWIDEFLEEVSSFPVGAPDDQVDAMSQALAQMSELIRRSPAGLTSPRSRSRHVFRNAGADETTRPATGGVGSALSW